MHEQLVSLCEAQDPRVVPHAAKVAAVLAEVLGHGKQLVAGPVGLRAAQLLHRLQGAVPGECGRGRGARGRRVVGSVARGRGVGLQQRLSHGAVPGDGRAARGRVSGETAGTEGGTRREVKLPRVDASWGPGPGGPLWASGQLTL